MRIKNTMFQIKSKNENYNYKNHITFIYFYIEMI